jgi:hypothetical protein
MGGGSLSQEIRGRPEKKGPIIPRYHHWPISLFHVRKSKFSARIRMDLFRYLIIVTGRGVVATSNAIWYKANYVQSNDVVSCCPVVSKKRYKRPFPYKTDPILRPVLFLSSNPLEYTPTRRKIDSPVPKINSMPKRTSVVNICSYASRTQQI